MDCDMFMRMCGSGIRHKATHDWDDILQQDCRWPVEEEDGNVNMEGKENTGDVQMSEAGGTDDLGDVQDNIKKSGELDADGALWYTQYIVLYIRCL